MQSVVRPARVVSVCVLGEPQGPIYERIDSCGE